MSDNHDTETDPADIHIGEEEGRVAYDGLGEITALYNQLDTVIDTVEQRDPVNGAIILKPNERTRLLEFYVIGHAHLERFSAVLLYEAIGDKSLPPWNTINFFREFSQADRENLLYRTGVIDEGLKGEMKNIRDRRNELVHKQHKRMHLRADEHIGTMVDRAFSKIQEVDALVNEIAGIDPSD